MSLLVIFRHWHSACPELYRILLHLIHNSKFIFLMGMSGSMYCATEEPSTLCMTLRGRKVPLLWLCKCHNHPTPRRLPSFQVITHFQYWLPTSLPSENRIIFLFALQNKSFALQSTKYTQVQLIWPECTIELICMIMFRMVRMWGIEVNFIKYLLSTEHSDKHFL